MHQPKVEFNNKKIINLIQMCNKELKIHQKKEKNRERERERERESIHLFVWAKYRQYGREKNKYLQ